MAKKPKPDPKAKVTLHFKVTAERAARYREAARVLYHDDGSLSMFLRRAADKLADEMPSFADTINRMGTGSDAR